MRNMVTAFLLLLSITFLNAPSFAADVYVPGSTNGWVFNENSIALLKTGLGSVNYYGYTAQFVQGSQFLITLGNSFTYKWCGGYWIPGGSSVNSVWTIPQNGDNIQINGANVSSLKSYCHLCIKQPADGSPVQFGLMTLENAPKTVNLVTDDYSGVGAGHDVTVQITLSGEKSASEKVYVRYTTDSWVTSKVVEAAAGANPYSAVIPAADVIGTNQNSYYVLTTTFSLENGQNSDYYDIRTINYKNNSGSNFALPVELTAFAASAIGNEVHLKWSTATEQNNLGFAIERKPAENGKWEKVAFVDGNGTSYNSHDYSYTDKSNLKGNYSYRLKQIDNDGKFKYSQTAEVSVCNMPLGFVLAQNFPNPFNPSTTINFGVDKTTNASVIVFDILGRQVASLFNGQAEASKMYSVEFNASNLSSGIYYYKLQTSDLCEVRKMILAK